MKNLKSQKNPILFIPKAWLSISLLFGITGLISGIFFDLNLSDSLYQKETLFEALGYCYGPLPLFWCLSVLGINLVLERKKETFLYLLSIIAGLALILFSIWYTGSHSLEFFSNRFAVWILAIITVLIPCLLIYRSISRSAQGGLLFKRCLFLAAGAALAFLLVTLLKELFMRPRFRFLISESQVDFKDWFSLEKPLILAGADMDQYRSFPSGHTASAACFIAFAFLYPPKKQNRVYLAGLVWTVLTALSRIIAGAHFLSDVSGGFVITLLSLWFVAELFERFKKLKGLQSQT